MMDIIPIEEKTYDLMKKYLNDFIETVKELCKDDEQGSEWLSNDQVCELLQISMRTLQHYRDTGILAYSRIEKKCYYRKSDLIELIEKSTVKNNGSKN